jgi:hypothetical protein
MRLIYSWTVYDGTISYVLKFKTLIFLVLLKTSTINKEPVEQAKRKS